MIKLKNALAEGYVLRSAQNQYRIERVLGSGGFGITYLASTTMKYGNVSVKINLAIKEHFLGSMCEREEGTSRVVYSNPVRAQVENSRKDFIAEARRLHKVGVEHPNIVKVNEVFEANNTAYYVMEYLDGESLRAYVRERDTLSEEEMHAIMTPIVDAVKSLHAARMTHLDIKPDNIMLTKDDDGNLRPVLIDFGLSKHYDAEGRPTSTINTLGCSDGYAPIEQYSGITTFSPAADIYALGATMAFCLTGKDPKKSTELLGENLADTLPAAVSEKTRAALAAMTAPQPARRTLPGTLPQQSSVDAPWRVPTSDPVPPRHAAAAANATQTLGAPKPRRRWPWFALAIAAAAIIAVFALGGKSAPSAPSAPSEIAATDTVGTRHGASTPTNPVEETPAASGGEYAPAPQTAAPAVALPGHEQPATGDLCALNDGKARYFTIDEWRRVSDQNSWTKRGVYVEGNGERFLLELKGNGRNITWHDAMTQYGDRLPSKHQAEVMGENKELISHVMWWLGGDSNPYGFYWTKDEINYYDAWVVNMCSHFTYLDGHTIDKNKADSCFARGVVSVP